MKRLRIKPGISGQIPVWILEEKHLNKWKQIYRHEDINMVKKVKDHLLQIPIIYTRKDSIPDKPIKTTPSSWTLKSKPKYLKVKRSDVPESLK